VTKSSKHLIGQRIERIQETHDYLQIFFAGGAILNIFNAHTIADGHDPEFAGYEITAAQEDKNAITLLMSPEGKIQIGLRTSDYRGPEAMVLLEEGKPTIIWP